MLVFSKLLTLLGKYSYLQNIVSSWLCISNWILFNFVANSNAAIWEWYSKNIKYSNDEYYKIREQVVRVILDYITKMTKYDVN